MRLISALGLMGEYSGVDNPKEGTVELWFSEATDAKQFSEAVLAKTSSRRPGDSVHSARSTSEPLRTQRFRKLYPEYARTSTWGS